MLAVATGKTRKGLDRAFEVSGLGPRFHASRCADECHSKPHPQMLEELMEEFGVAPEVDADDRRHHPRPADGQECRRRGARGGLWRPSARGLEAEAPLFCAANVAQLAQWLRQHA
jgi:phosphoglycolate phosphatase